MSELEIKPCPFCGGGAGTNWEPENVPAEYVVACMYCGAEGMNAVSEDEAIKLWNKRAGDGSDG